MRIQGMLPAAMAMAMAMSCPAAATPQLPTDSHWRTFAKPLALGTGGMLLFQRDGGQAVVWRVDWKTGQTTSFKLDEVTLRDDGRYTAIAGKEGIWLIGQRTVLVRPNGQRLFAETGYNEPVATALDDGSVAVFGKSRGDAGGRIQQLRLDTARIEVRERGLLSYDGAANQNGQPYRQPGYGHAVARLNDGRVLMLGGDRTSTLASIVAPRDDTAAWPVTPVAAMPHPRTGSAALTLPDGRVVVTGAPHLNCASEAENVRSADIYDPAADRWSTLPPLPFPPCADSYGADAPSIAVTPGGSLVVGGHLEPHVMVLRRDAASPTGFASGWSVHGQFPLGRTGGVVQALSDTQVVAAGGAANRDEQCCYATAGIDRIAIGSLEDHASRAMRYVGAGAARRGTRVFVAAGRRFGFTGFGQMRYSAYAELIDLASGKSRQLPSMPFVSGGAQALWIDDDRVLVKGVPAADDRGFSRRENLASSVPASSGALAIFNVKLNRWSETIALPELAGSALLDAAGNEARLLSADGIQHLNLETRRVRDGARLTAKRVGGAARLVAPGRLVVAGGEAQSERVSVIDEACEARSPSPCPEFYTGFGPLAPAAGVESIPLDGGESELSPTVAGEAAASAAVIARDGAVYLLVTEANGESQRLMRAVPGSAGWQPMPAPGGAALCGGQCAILLAPDPRDASRELLFWRRGAIDSMGADDRVEQLRVDVWVWNETRRAWEQVLETDGMSARAVPLVLDGQALGAKDNPIMSMGWHLDAPILWTTRDLPGAQNPGGGARPRPYNR